MPSLTSVLCSLYCLIFFAIGGECSQEKYETYRTIDINHLLPRSICSSSKASRSRSRSSLEVAHRHGPCSPFHPKPKVEHRKMLEADRARGNAIRSRTETRPSQIDADPSIPASRGELFGTGNYVVTVGLGSTKMVQTMVIDTANDLSWVQCLPCASCHPQNEPIFDPFHSSTYANFSCVSSECLELGAVGCAAPTCTYDLKHEPSGISASGFFASDTLTLTSFERLSGFRFGCGQNNSGFPDQAAGLLGLGPGKESVLSQAYDKFDGVFSYCFPSTVSSIGYLTFGESSRHADVKYTPMVANPPTPHYYYLDLVAIYVGRKALSIPPSVFSNAGTVIDSGTVITRLPASAYSALRAEFQLLMSGYKSAPPYSILDTCYDITGLQKMNITSVALEFGGGITTDLVATGIMYVQSLSRACLAFAGNSNDDELGIIGNIQQRGFRVVYDVANRGIGFAPEDC